MQVKKNSSLRGLRLALILISPVLWLAVLSWPAIAHSQQETRWPTHYVIVVRNTSLRAKGVELIKDKDFRTALKSIPRGLEAASGQIPLWRKPEPGDLISVVFAAATSPNSSGKPGCESHPLIRGQTGLNLGTYFDVRSRIDVEESPSDIADQLYKSVDVENCDLIASSYSEGLTLAKGLATVGNANGEEKYKQFFLLVFDFASPAYGLIEFNAKFNVSHEDLAPGTPAYLIAPIGSLNFADGDWSLDLVHYLDYPVDEEPLLSPRDRATYFQRDIEKFYPRLRFYRAVALEASSDPFYKLADAQQKVEGLEKKAAGFETRIDIYEYIAAVSFALLIVLATWWWRAIKGRFRRMTAEYQKTLQQMREEQSRLVENCERQLLQVRQALAEEFREKQAALEAEKENLRSRLTSAVCIPDAPHTDRAGETA